MREEAAREGRGEESREKPLWGGPGSGLIALSKAMGTLPPEWPLPDTSRS